MIRIALSLLMIALSICSCSLFDGSEVSRSEILASGEAYADSVTLKDAGAYSIYISSDYALDIFFFEIRDGFEAFLDSGALYSEYIFQPLSYANETYVDGIFNTFEGETKLYFVIDNTDAVTGSSGNAYYTLEIKKI